MNIHEEKELNAYADTSSVARSLILSLSLTLHLYFMYARRKGSDETALRHRHIRVIRACRCNKDQNLVC